MPLSAAAEHGNKTRKGTDMKSCLIHKTTGYMFPAQTTAGSVPAAAVPGQRSPAQVKTDTSHSWDKPRSCRHAGSEPHPQRPTTPLASQGSSLRASCTSRASWSPRGRVKSSPFQTEPAFPSCAEHGSSPRSPAGLRITLRCETRRGV